MRGWVFGLCALLVGAFPDLRPFEVKSVLRWFSDWQGGRGESERDRGSESPFR